MMVNIVMIHLTSGIQVGESNKNYLYHEFQKQ